MQMTRCRYFTGAKPCGKNAVCDQKCASYDQIHNRILIIHLGALGAVVRSTSLLKAIKQKYSNSHVTWITDKPGHQLLLNHPLVDKVLTTETADLLELSACEFEACFIIDKSLKAAGILKWTSVDQVFGFVSDPQLGIIVPATQAADELWQIGLSNQKKFFENKKPETQLIAEALELNYQRDEYNLPLTIAEKNTAELRQSAWSQGQLVLGINTGCSAIIPAKKLTTEFQREVIKMLQQKFLVSIVLLGGPEDSERNQQIAHGLNVIQSPTNLGLRDGLVSVAACDFIFTGDSLGMHMSISQKKWTVAWFGPTCDHEIDFYDRGESLRTAAGCSPCWKKSCTQSVMCYDQLSMQAIEAAIARGLNESYRCRPDSILGGSTSLYSSSEKS